MRPDLRGRGGRGINPDYPQKDYRSVAATKEKTRNREWTRMDANKESSQRALIWKDSSMDHSGKHQ
jgi:hypothetical protein